MSMYDCFDNDAGIIVTKIYILALFNIYKSNTNVLFFYLNT